MSGLEQVGIVQQRGAGDVRDGAAGHGEVKGTEG